MWFYTADGSEKKGPVEESEIRNLLAQGQLKNTDLVWCEGMDDWAAINTLPAFQGPAPIAAAPVAAAPGGGVSAAPAGEDELPPGLLGWMSFVGVMTIIGGVFYLCSFLIGIFPIIAGVALMGAKTALSEVTRVDPAMRPFLDKIKTYMVMTGVMFIIMIVLSIIFIILYAVLGVAAFSSMGSANF
jgi:hypothetical protein